jgi:hypothetical protein
MITIEPKWKTSTGQSVRINADSMNNFFTDKQKMQQRYVNREDGKKWFKAGVIFGGLYEINDQIPQKVLNREKAKSSGQWDDIANAFIR